MARNFNFGAEVATGGGAVFKNPDVGDHESIITAIVHVGSFQDHFKKGGKVDIKKPCNYVLVRATLMGDEDLNEDGSRMEQWTAVALKNGDKATLTKLLNAVDPKEEMDGFDSFIMAPFTVSMVGDEKGGKNEDGTFKYVNWKGFSGCPAKLAKLVLAQVEEEGITAIGHITFDQITKDVLDAIPAHMVRQYFLNETQNGKNLSVEGSAVADIIAAAREADAEWKKRKVQEGDATPERQRPLDTGAQVPSSVPEAENVATPEMDDEQEY
ncbi:hypothetical protein POP72_022 [Pectobacterium phage POP72]|uniref:Uncharacterized protein n=2 Tax=Axomammavirus PP1 TaxID=2733578 RepID=I7EWB2_9CAUD|nr:hypothetical protein F486_gp20 [Pectobacterium phage PP1]AFP33683.1 hypothetical protein PP1_020 [Pectobacterium phage PP1]ARB10938.1 hypothetical protein POP72_022 [Pectobacterium phage POP72]